MQISKAGVVAAGALVTVAVMGSAAAAAPPAGPTHADSTKAAATTLGLMANQRVMTATKQAFGPHDKAVQPLISIFGGSSLQAVPLQVCGSTAQVGPGLTLDAKAANTVVGDCASGNVAIRQTRAPGIISILDDTSVSAVPTQICGSNVAIAGVTAALDTPNVVTGSCYNANTVIAAPEGHGPKSLIALGSGSVLNLAALQFCGSTAAVAGVAAGVQSPTVVLGDCKNAGVAIQKREPAADIPLLTNTNLNLLPLQVCGQSSFASLGGLAVPPNSPAYVAGDCSSGEEFID